MNFEITILGSNAAIPTLTRGNTAQYIQCNQRHILIDCGEGTQLQLRKFKIKYQQISIILISHLHGDHVFGLPGLLSTMQLMGRDKGLKLFGPLGLKKLIETQLGLVGVVQSFNVEIIELTDNSNELIFSDKCIEIYNFPLKHRIPTHGYLIKEKTKPRKLNKEAFDKYNISTAYISNLLEGKNVLNKLGELIQFENVTYPPPISGVYAYCSDTAFDERIVEFIKSADILYHESTFLQSELKRAQETFHSTAEEAAIIAKRANVKRLILGHFSSRYKDLSLFKEQASKHFLEVFIPKDGDKFVIN